MELRNILKSFFNGKRKHRAFIHSSAFTSSVLCTCVMLSLSSVSHASVLVETTIGRTPVSDQSASGQQRAIRKAMENALVKLTGKSDVADYQGVGAIVKSADRYLRSYSFDAVDNQLFYTAEFDQTMLESDVAALGLPIWGKRRPDSVLWFAFEDENDERTVLGESSASDYKDRLVAAAYDRGMPLSLPLLDLTDTLQVSIYDVWGLFSTSLESASERYGVDYVLGARLYKNSASTLALPQTPQTSYALPKVTLPAFAYGDMASVDYHIEMALGSSEESGPSFTQSEFNALSKRVRQGRFSLDWLIDRDGEVSRGTLFGDDTGSLIAKFIDAVADDLGNAYAILPSSIEGEGKTVTMVVNNLDSYKKYIDVQAYINSLSVVDSAALTKQYGATSEFTLSLLGTAADLNNVLRLESRLRPQTDTFGQPLEGFQFSWRD